MSSFADDIERLVKLHGVADDGVKPLIEKAIEMLIEKERECRRVDFPPPCIPPFAACLALSDVTSRRKSKNNFIKTLAKRFFVCYTVTCETL